VRWHRYGSLSCAGGGVAPLKLTVERQLKPETLAWQAIGMQKIKYLMSKAMFYGGLFNVVVKGAPRYRCLTPSPAEQPAKTAFKCAFPAKAGKGGWQWLLTGSISGVRTSTPSTLGLTRKDQQKPQPSNTTQNEADSNLKQDCLECLHGFFSFSDALTACLWGGNALLLSALETEPRNRVW
jgi:hypothetical protein